MSFSNPDDEGLRALLQRTRTIAVVGASPKPARPAHYVMQYLQRAGYAVTPIRPGGSEILGVRCVAALSDLSAPPDLVDVFRRAEFVPGIVDEAIALGARALWLQDGVVHVEAALRARAAGLTVVMNTCTLREHRRLLG